MDESSPSRQVRRRSVLAAASAGTALLSGCLSDVLPVTGSDPDDEDSGTVDRDPYGIVEGKKDGSDSNEGEKDGSDSDEGEKDDSSNSASDDESEGDSEEGEDYADLRRELTETSVHEFETAPLTAALNRNPFRTVDGFEVVVDLTEPATEESPAIVTALVHNTRPYEQTIRPGRLPGFDDPPEGAVVDREDVLNQVYLAPTEAHELAERVPEVERDDEGRWRLAEPVGSDWFPSRLSLGPERSLVGEYALVADSTRYKTPVRPSTYRFSVRDHEFEIVVWDSEAPGPDAESRFEGEDVPSLPRDGSAAWFHEADPETEVYLEPSAETVEPPATVEFDLVNHSHEEFSGNSHDWTLYKLVDGGFHRIAPWMIPMPMSYLSPGATEESSLQVVHGESDPGSAVRAVGPLGGGRYAYRVGYGHDGGAPAALFDLDAPVITVEPTDGVEVDREGTEVVVTAPEWEDDDYPDDATLTVERTDEDPEGRLIPEQLYQRPNDLYRDVLPFFETGVERVVYRADRNTVRDDVLGRDTDRRTFAYGDQAFTASVEGHED